MKLTPSICSFFFLSSPFYHTFLCFSFLCLHRISCLPLTLVYQRGGRGEDTSTIGKQVQQEDCTSVSLCFFFFSSLAKEKCDTILLCSFFFFFSGICKVNFCF